MTQFLWKRSARCATRAARVGLAGLVASVVAVSGCSQDTGSKAAFCQQVKVVPPLAGVVAGFDRAHPDELARRLDGARRAYRQLARSAPSAIDHDTAELVNLVNQVLDAVGNHARDPAAVASTLRRDMSRHRDASASAAAVSAYADKECDVRLDPPVGEASPATTPPTSTDPAG